MPKSWLAWAKGFVSDRLYNVPVRLIDQILFGYYLVPDFLIFLVSSNDICLCWRLSLSSSEAQSGWC